MPVATDVHHKIAELARQMHAVPESTQDSTGQVLGSITAGAVEYVPGAQYAGVLLVDQKKNFDTLAPTDSLMITADQIQKETGEGPCLLAAWDHHTVLVNDIRTDERFPAFSARVIDETSLRSSLSFKLFTDKGTIGALNLFSEETDVFGDESLEVGLLFATHAALALRAARQQQHFQSALASRDVIGQAKGMIMYRFRIDAVAAFALLRRLSQDTNTPLAKVAEQLIERELSESGEAGTESMS
ncbi:GAF and ANTAR domain-containing protein [Gordonia McavH-238-E]|uniref:GAF and ANTAR domain-containing protein n=1 Tax=Gordonia sp. McavH-238-E TaxID=2917736 RepID=UPI001EF4AD5B|nr:GAF and ANTAR domain-containing protein [Gordonia sp. McavH-238-E]MCG7632659.1 GAF and ANTAR domain-containing protein [Gordonia sp. McavH-238-E]